MKKFFLVGALFLSPSIFTVDLAESIEQAININGERPFNGVVLVAKGDQVIFEKAQGSYGSPTSCSQFIIASISKQITAVIILQLIEKGLIELNDPIKKYLLDFPYDWTSRVTVKQLLNHTSGVQNLGEPLAFEPGTRFFYTNTAYNLLGQIAQNVSGKTYSALVTELFHKCNMTNSGISGSGAITEIHKRFNSLIPGFIINENMEVLLFLDRKSEEFDSSSGVISTAYDMLKWNMCLHNGKLLKSETYQQMTGDVIKYDLENCNMITTVSDNSEVIGYGFGVNLIKNVGHKVITHVGYMYGYGCVLSYYPGADISVIIFENVTRNKAPFLEVHKKIHEIVSDYLNNGILRNV